MFYIVTYNADNAGCNCEYFVCDAGNGACEKIIGYHASRNGEGEKAGNFRLLHCKGNNGNKGSNGWKQTVRTFPGKKSEYNIYKAENNNPKLFICPFFAFVQINSFSHCSDNCNRNSRIGAKQSVMQHPNTIGNKLPDKQFFSFLLLIDYETDGNSLKSNLLSYIFHKTPKFLIL